jgi:hypothetical protein
VELRITREVAQASAGDLLFAGHAFSDIPRLLKAFISDNPLSSEYAREIDMRIASASPAPWTEFIESDGGLAGSDVIRVSESDAEADMYLWMGANLAPSSVYRFVAGARQDVPTLLAAVRE